LRIRTKREHKGKTSGHIPKKICIGVGDRTDKFVRVREPPHRKEWETIGRPWLLVIGDYRLGFEIASAGESANLRVFIGHNLPSSPELRLLGYIFGRVYARWCVRQMVDGARANFDGNLVR
jgi:hypothetical protein